MMVEKGRKERKIALLLYAIIVLFFVVVLFGLTVSGEDILQGAGNLRNDGSMNILADLQASFDNNGRITDMYAWSVIDLFDYQFRFGVDTIFRVADLIMSCGLFYLMAYAVLGRRPQLKIKDGLVCLVLFLAIILTPHGRVLYAGFSAIHNYMIGAFIFMAFVLLYMRMVLEKRIKEVWWRIILMFVFGVIFGMSAALTPIAFLIVAIGYMVINRKKECFSLYAIMGLAGTIVGFLISNVFGPGVGGYSNNEVYINAYDYIAFSDIFNNIPKIIMHWISNFGRVALPALALGGVLLMVCDRPKQFFTKRFYKTIEQRKKCLMIAGIIFVVILILGSFQVNAPIRILFPAYIVSIIEVLMLFWPYVKNTRVFSFGIVGLAMGILLVKIVLTVDYSAQSAEVFDYILQVDGETVCVDRDEVKAYNFPVIYLGQEDMLAEWAMPEPIYGKMVVFCDY